MICLHISTVLYVSINIRQTELRHLYLRMKLLLKSCKGTNHQALI